MHAEAGKVFRVEQRPPLREVHRGEIVDPVAKRAAIEKKIKTIRTALATRAVPDEEAWKLITDYLTTDTKVDMTKIAGEVTEGEPSDTPLDLVRGFLIGKRAVHLDLIDIGRTNSIPSERQAVLAEASKRVPIIHAEINQKLTAPGADPEVTRTQVQALRIVEALLAESPQTKAYTSYMARPHQGRLTWVAPNLRP